MVLKSSLQESTDNKYVGYVEQWMVYAKETGNIEIHNLLDFLVPCLIKKWHTLP